MELEIMKKFALISFFVALCLECVAMVPHSVKAAKGWLFYESGAVSAPVVCRVEAEVPSSAAGHIVLENGDSYINLKFGKVKAERHVLALQAVQDNRHEDKLVVSLFDNGQMVGEPFSCRKPSGSWKINVSGKVNPLSLNVFVPDPNHEIVVPKLDFSEKADKFIDDLMGRMTLDEKIGQLSQYVGSSLMTGPESGQFSDSLVRRDMMGSVLNATGSKALRQIQEKYMTESRLKIPLLFGMDVIHGYRTLTPVPLAEACSWDMEAIEASARMAAVEASAAGVHWTFAPMVDIGRDARWGRVVEGAGEDPFLCSQIAAARVNGFQWNLWDNDAVIACAKHWIGYGLPQAGRDYAPVDMSERTLYDVYLPPFKAASNAGVLTYMSAFHDLNGIPASGDQEMLRKFLQNEWGFDGFVVSDWQSVIQLIAQGVAEDGKDAAQIAFNAGVDMDMIDGLYNAHLHELVDEGLVRESDIDDACRRILRVKYSLGLFEDPYKFFDEEREEKTLLNDEFVASARKLACKSMVLLRNENQLLPLSKNTGSIALIGPLADNRHEINGSWRCRAEDSDAVTVLAGLRNKLGDNVVINYAKGCDFDGEDRSGFDAAVDAALKSDVVIAVVGEKALFSGESRSRCHLGLPGVQEELVERLVATGKPVVAVLMNGRPLCIENLNNTVPAILEAWFPGTTTGDAVADVLFGDYNPSGRLAITFPRAEGQIPAYYNYKRSGRPGDMERSSTVRHIDVPNAPLYPFGYGLSYSSFSYGKPFTDKESYTRRDTVNVYVDVTNTGARDGEETVQVYVSDLVASVVRPVMELKGFAKVFLRAGETRRVKVCIDPLSLGFYNADMDYVVEDGLFDIHVGHDSADYDTTRIKIEN